MGLTLELHTFVNMLICLQLSLVHCSHSLRFPVEPPPRSLSLADISVRLNSRWQLILSPYRQSCTLVDSLVECHLASGIHSTHIGAKVLPPSRCRSFLRPAGGLYGFLVHPLHWSSLLIVWQALRCFFWVVNSRAASRVTVGCL